MENFRPISEGENPIRKEEIYEWIIDEATRLDLPAIINMLAVVGRWDESPILKQVREVGVNNSYCKELS